MSTILITGGSGFIGQHLIPKLLSKGHEVAVLSRSRKSMPGVKTYHWDIENGELEQKVPMVNYIIHLAGVNIGEKRWTATRKKEIVDSRVQTAQLLFDRLGASGKVKAFITASGVGYYGMVTSDKIFSEVDPAGNDFLSRVCSQWENAAQPFMSLGIRTVQIRTAVVLAKDGGALPKMLAPVKFGLAAPLGSGLQYLPWIHVEDLCAIYLQALENDTMVGPYNAVAPEHITNKQFMKTAAEVLHKPFAAPQVPSFALKLALGEMAEMLLTGSRVSSKKILATGFQFKYPKLKRALEEITR